MICAGPGIGPLGKTSVGEIVQSFLERIVLAPEEDEVLQDVRQTVVVVSLSRQAEVTVHHRGLRLGHRHGQTWLGESERGGGVRTHLWLQIYIC